MSSSSDSLDNAVNDQPVKNVGQWQKNLTYWHADGSIVIRVSCSPNYHPTWAKFSPFPARLEKKAPSYTHFISLESLCKNSKISCYGCIDFSEWTPMAEPSEKERILTNLLKIASLWEIDVGRQYAQNHLEAIALPPSRRLELARQFSIHEWVSPAIHEIFHGKLGDLTDVDVARMGVKVYSIVAKGMEVMETELKRTANVEPLMSTDPDWQCTTHSACIATWKRLWWDKIGRQLLRPERALKTKDIQAEVEKLTHKDLHEGCRLDMVRKIQYEVEFSDQRLIQGVVEAVVRTTQVFEISWVMYIYSRQDENK
ncbi:hypothetical protein R3P38DRAFT_3570633 [Favolaschia claudopus]|uniref:Uncharacterized protein n=1 Tax=Favolaschia claudopus TaxID=2862362 RepID=A0AAW0AR32_9AGAR